MSLTRPLILASASPRRADLLAQVGLPFRILASGIDETPPSAGEDILAWAQRTALAKAHATAAALPSAESALVLAADTVVLLPLNANLASAPRLADDPVQVLGKPCDANHARVMLQQLSGKSHVVVSAFAVLACPEGDATTDVAVTRVHVRALTDAEIDWYVASGEPLDKAGAYGIQGLGAVLVDAIDGDYNTVVGLPLARLWQCLTPWRTIGRR